MLGIALAITAALCWGTGAVFARLGLQRLKPATGVFNSMLSSIFLVVTLALLIYFDDIVSLSPQALLWFALIGVVTYVIGRQFNYAGIRHIGVTRATPIFASAPLFAMVLAVTFLGESVNAWVIIGTLSIIGGLSLMVTSR